MKTRTIEMQKVALVLSIFGVLVFGRSAFCAERDQVDFSGNWVLDKAKTRNVPAQLKSYTMVVTQNEQQLKVETKVDGDLTPGGAPGEGFPGPPPGGPDGGSLGEPDAGGPPPRGGIPGGRPPSGFMALKTVVPSATYSLAGKETTAELRGPMPGTVRLKAKRAKDERALELSAVRQFDFQGNSATFTTKETWKLSDDGQVLNLQRTVEAPFGTEKVKLTFNKEKTHASEETQ